MQLLKYSCSVLQATNGANGKAWPSGAQDQSPAGTLHGSARAACHDKRELNNKSIFLITIKYNALIVSKIPL